ncbi:phosphomevalonate kinase [Streptomyces sp. NPDC048484]|uniref:phosphomevalonate kinase n=1 Tax=Streptomyces sp. NPDC048484 TaxID=3155146 RepID=UPI00343F8299
MPDAVTCRAPGKLFVAGEYAVLEPGEPAVVVAVDRHVTVSATRPSGAEVVLATDLLAHEVRLRRGAAGLSPLDPSDLPHARGPLAHLISVIEVIDVLRADRGLPAVPVRLEARSALHEQGVKIGLGSSGAVTVAAVDAFTALCGMATTRETLFRLALLASVRVDAGPSGADLAASAWGGWVCYRSPDRDALREALGVGNVAATLCAAWPGLSVRGLPPPTRLDLHCGWSGSPASTPDRVRRLTREAWWHSAARGRFLTRSSRCVRSAVRALEQDDPAGLVTALRDSRRLLADLDAETKLGIFTAALTELCEAAEACGGAGKPSGAGGGDCGIALLPADSSAGLLRGRWSGAGIAPLSLSVAPAASDRAPRHEAGPELLPLPLPVSTEHSSHLRRGQPR